MTAFRLPSISSVHGIVARGTPGSAWRQYVPISTRSLLAAAFFLALAIVNTYPLARAPGSSIGSHGDAWFSVWRLAWIAHQLRTDPRHLFDANIYYPEANTLAYSDAMLLPGFILAPLHWVGADALALYNFTLLGAFVLSALAAYVLVRALTGSTAAGVLAGIVFAFSPFRFEHFDHLELQFAFWIPLAVLFWHRALASQARGDFLRVALLVTGQVLSCIYYGVFLLTWLAFVTVLWFMARPVRAMRALGWMLTPPILVLAVYSRPYLENRDRLGDRSETDVAGYSAELTDYLSAPSTNVLYGWTDELGASERHLFPGVVTALFLVVGLWPPVNRVRLLYAAALLVALQLTLGFNGVLYRGLYEWVLPFRGLRVPARANILVLLAASVLAGFGLARVLAAVKRPAAARVISTLVIVGTALECLTRPTVQPVDRRISEWYPWLRKMPDAVVFEWPVTVPWRLYDMVDVTYMYRSTLHWRPLLNGYSGFYPYSYVDLLLAVRGFPDTPSLAYLQERGATVLVLHEVPGSRPSYQDAVARLERDPKLRLIATDTDAGQRVTFWWLDPNPSDSRHRRR